MDTNYKIFPSVGALTRPLGDVTYAKSILEAYTDATGIIVALSDGTEEHFNTTNAIEERNTGRIVFSSDNVDYRIRELREDDGAWISKYKTYLPVPALEQLIKQNAKDSNMDSVEPEQETLQAYAMDDSVYVVGLVYHNELGDWARIDGDWVLLVPNDTTYADAAIIDIDPEKADQFIALFDNNYVTVTDAETYEIPATATEM